MKNVRTIDELKEMVKEYDVISFDVFDTLITRRVLKPSDVFLLVNEKIKREKGLDFDFYSQRIQAEEIATRKNGGKYSTEDQIYAELRRIGKLDQDLTDEIKQLEYECEKKVVVCIEDMLDIYKMVKQCKKVVLISDMYLNSIEINGLLEQGGYEGNDKVYVSSELKCSKDSVELWNKIRKEYNELKILHIGDNERNDVIMPEKVGIDSIKVRNPYQVFRERPIYKTLGIYDDGILSHSLVLGDLVNCCLYASSFENDTSCEKNLGIWLGVVFKKFISWLAENARDRVLLFVTRESIILRPMYQNYCRILGLEEADNIDFYVSRRSVTPISLKTADDFRKMFDDYFEGTIGKFSISHFNFSIPDENIANNKINLPIMKNKAFIVMKEYREKILENAKRARELYKEYIVKIKQRFKNKELCLVDVGYRGTTQYYLHLGTEEIIDGLYLFLNPGSFPERIGLSTEAIARTSEGRHPLYDNLLFLEATMQVKQGMTLALQHNANTIEPILAPEDYIDEGVKRIQKAYFDYVSKEAKFEKEIGLKIDYDLIFAEDIFASLIENKFIPESIIKNLYIKDDYSGNDVWKYDESKMCWASKSAISKFLYIKPDQKTDFKYSVKNFIKKHSPNFLYEYLRVLWIKYIK